MSANNEENSRRYHSIGRLVDNHVYNIMENGLQLRRISIPVCVFIVILNKVQLVKFIFYQVDARPSEPTGFFFASNDLIKADYLMIIIHGMGVVRAGQWSRKYLVTNSLL